VSEIPTTTPLLLLTGQATALLKPGPPRAPRSITCGPPTHKAACETLSSCWLANPVAQPRLLIPAPPPLNPPSVSSGTILYMVCAVCEVSRTGAIANAATKAIPAMHVDILNFMLPPIDSLFRPRDRDVSLRSSVADAGIQPRKNKQNPVTPSRPARQNRATGRMRLDVCGPDYRPDRTESFA
jgi:hypothetical protein